MRSVLFIVTFGGLWIALSVGVGAAPSETPRESSVTSLFTSVFQFFESTVEMVIGFFLGPDDEGSGGNQSDDSRSSRSYKNFQVLRVLPRTETALRELEPLQDEPGLEFWSPPMANRSADLVVPPAQAEYLREFLLEHDIEFTVLSTNLELDIQKQNPKPPKNFNRKRLKSDRGHLLTWTRYHRFKDIDGYLDYLSSSMPDLVKVMTIGKSNEGRPLKVVNVSSGKKKKPNAVWIDGGMHGREWVSPATALFILKQLTENYATNRAVVDGIDWYIMPVANPDGYEFSHTSDRFWRKNRAKNPKSDDYDEARFFWGDSDETCNGVDLNRNWDFHWKEVGASDNPCRANYAGTGAFSEPETKAISDFIMEKSDRIKAYLTLHSYSQMFLVPWGYTKQTSKDYDDLMYLGRKAVEALQRVYGTVYKIGNSPTLLYPTSGSSDDWAKGKAGIKYSYTIELRDKGTYGFLLPASQILPTGRETFAAVKTIAKHIINSPD